MENISMETQKKISKKMQKNSRNAPETPKNPLKKRSFELPFTTSWGEILEVLEFPKKGDGAERRLKGKAKLDGAVGWWLSRARKRPGWGGGGGEGSLGVCKRGW